MAADGGGSDWEQILRGEVEWALLPLTDALASRKRCVMLLQELGWNPEKVLKSGYAEFVQHLEGVPPTILGLVDVLLHLEELDDFEAWGKLIKLVSKDLIPTISGGLAAIKDLKEGENSWGLRLADDLVDHLICRYLRTRAVLLYDVLVLLEVIRLPGRVRGRIPKLTEDDLWEEKYLLVGETTTVPKKPDPPLRYARRAPEVDLGRLADLLTGKAGLMDPYSPEGSTWRWPQNRREAMIVRDRLFPRLGAVAWDLECEAWYVRPPILKESVEDNDERFAPPAGQLAVRFFSVATEEGTEAEAGLHLQLFTPRDTPAYTDTGVPVFVLQPVGSISQTWDFGAWGEPAGS